MERAVDPVFLMIEHNYVLRTELLSIYTLSHTFRLTQETK